MNPYIVNVQAIKTIVYPKEKCIILTIMIHVVIHGLYDIKSLNIP